MKRVMFVCAMFASGLSLANTLDLNATLQQCRQLSGSSVGQTEAKPTVVTFSATWCGPCSELMPKNEALAEKYGDKVNFVYVMTGGSELAAAQKDGATYSMMSYFINDPDTLTKSLDIPYYPYSILLDKNETEVFTGGAEDDFDAYTNMIDSLAKSH